MSSHAIIQSIPPLVPHLFANYGFQPHFSVVILANLVNPSVKEHASLLKEVHHDLALELTLAQERIRS